MIQAATNHSQATLGGGCFWCLEAVFDELEGVIDAVSGYSGGHITNPSYRDVCEGITGHAEVVQITFDSSVLSYSDLLRVFFVMHDPTTLNRQGADVGNQYRSVIFHHDETQKAEAEAMIAEIDSAGIYANSIVTEVVPATTFFAAEDYHQEYFKRNPYQGYCQAVVAPKLAKFRKRYTARLKKAVS